MCTGKANPHPRVSITANKQKTKKTQLCLFYFGSGPVINLPLSSWLIIPGNSDISGAQCWSLMLTDWARSHGHSQIGTGKWKSVFLSPCITSTPATMASMFMSPLGNDRRAVERDWLESTEWVYSWLLKSSSAEVTFWWNINIFMYFANSERFIHILL